jgi:hypothetical protein
MIIKLTNAERDTVLAALRRWQSYPAAREADSLATHGGKHRPLDNLEIERICERLTKIKGKRERRPCFANQTMAPASGKSLKLRVKPSLAGIRLQANTKSSRLGSSGYFENLDLLRNAAE